MLTSKNKLFLNHADMEVFSYHHSNRTSFPKADFQATAAGWKSPEMPVQDVALLLAARHVALLLHGCEDQAWTLSPAPSLCGGEGREC